VLAGGPEEQSIRRAGSHCWFPPLAQGAFRRAWPSRNTYLVDLGIDLSVVHPSAQRGLRTREKASVNDLLGGVPVTARSGRCAMSIGGSQQIAANRSGSLPEADRKHAGPCRATECTYIEKVVPVKEVRSRTEVSVNGEARNSRQRATSS